MSQLFTYGAVREAPGDRGSYRDRFSQRFLLIRLGLLGRFCIICRICSKETGKKSLLSTPISHCLPIGSNLPWEWPYRCQLL